jgi:hypothetical protein
MVMFPQREHLAFRPASSSPTVNDWLHFGHAKVIIGLFSSWSASGLANVLPQQQ